MKKIIPIILLVLFPIFCYAQTVTYYVSSSTGNDSNNGTSSATPWKTLAKVMQGSYIGGDSILLKGGDTLYEQLLIGPSNTDQYGDHVAKVINATGHNPFVVSSYGTGRAVINCNTLKNKGSDGSGVDVYNVGGIEIQNLVLVGYSGITDTTYKNYTTGINIDVNDTNYVGIKNFIKVQNCDISGYDQGIQLGDDLTSTTLSGYDSVYIYNNVTHDLTVQGISSYGEYGHPHGYNHRNVIIRGNLVYNVPGILTAGAPSTGPTGSGITLGQCISPTIEYNTVHDCGGGTNNSSGPVGIWAYDCDSALIQYNEVYNQKTLDDDGDGFDFDGGMSNSIMQYNYSHNNYGAGYMFYSYNDGSVTTWNNNTMRYNISINDDINKKAYGALTVWGNSAMTNPHVYNNTVYNDSSNTILFIVNGATNVQNGQAVNNILYDASGKNTFVSTFTFNAPTTFSFINNDYFSNGNTDYVWNKVTYTSLSAWRTSTNQETYNSTSTGLTINPSLNNTGGMPNMNGFNASLLSGYQLSSSSTLINAGMPMSNFSLNSGNEDFFGTPSNYMNKLSIGAAQYISTPNYLRPGVLDSAFHHNSWGWDVTATMLVYLPWNYYVDTTKIFPMIMSFSGNGEKGNGGSQLWNLEGNGIPQLISQGHVPYAVNKSTGDTTWFIVTALQTPGNIFNSTIPAWYQDMTLSSAYGLRVDTNRIYTTGYSQGGEDCLRPVNEGGDGFTPAAIISMSPAHSVTYSDSYNLSLFKKVPIWFFQGDNDGTVGQTGTISYDTLLQANPQEPLMLTQYSGGHCCWVNYYTPSYNNSTDVRTSPSSFNGNIYQWVMQYTVNKTLSPPIVNAGNTQTLAANTTTTTLSGTATSTNGAIASYQWTQVSGATITFGTPNAINTTVSGLTNGSTYTFKLTAVDDSGLSASAQVNVIVNSQPIDTPDYQIVLSQYAKFWNGDTVFYQINDLNGNPGIDSLFDEQYKTPWNGLVPTTLYTNWQGSEPKYHSEVVVDLGGMYKIDTLFGYFNNSYTPLWVQYGKPLNWSTDTITISPAPGWRKNVDSIYTRYLKIQYGNGGNPRAMEFEIAGHLVGDSLTRIAPTSSPEQYVDGNTMGYFMGVNEAGTIPPFLFTQVAGIIRNYTNQTYLDTAGGGHNIDSVNFVFDKFSANSPTVLYSFPADTGGAKPSWTWQHYGYNSQIDSGMYEFYNRDSLPILLSSLQGDNQMEVDSGWGKTIDRTLYPNADTLNPQVYDRFSRMGWQIGAAFGKNIYPADSLQFSIPSIRSGLNTMQYIEPGNEINGSWKGIDYYSPGAFIAAMSAFYDGNGGRMGNRFGVKRADSTVQVVMPGDAAPNQFEYMKGMSYWSYYNNHGKVPFDIYNFHNYTYDMSQNTGTAPPRSAMSPENYNRNGWGNIRILWQRFVDSAHEFCPTCGVWNTEWGYDRNGNLPNAVPYVNGQDSTQVQANWIARSWVMESFVKGLGASVYYMLGNANWKQYDSLAINNYSTCGLLDQSIVSNPFTGGCCATNFYAYPSYYYTMTIFQTLHNYKPDSIIYENGLSDSVYAYRYVNASNPDSVAYVYWSGTISNKKITGMNIKAGIASQTVNNIQLKYKYFYGDTTKQTTNANGLIPITITETPNIIFTTKSANGGVISGTETNNPVANAGGDQTLAPGNTTSNLFGNAIGGSGTYTYQWSQISGNSVNIISPNSQNTSITGLQTNNIYQFKLTVTDSNNNVGIDTVTVTVLSSTPRALLYIINGKIVLVNY